MERKLRNRLLLLLTQKEQHEGRRIRQKEIAIETKINEHTISSWLKNDVTKFEAPIIERLCKYFNCEVGDLLYLEPVEDQVKE